MNHKLGVISIITAAFFYGFYGIFSRLIGSSFGNFNQNWIRNLIVLIVISVIIVATKTRLLSIRKKDYKWMGVWLLSGSWVTVLTFIAFNNLPIGTTYFIIYSAMITSGFLSGMYFFKEKLNIAKFISLLLSLTGLFIIYRFSLPPEKARFVVLALVSGLMTGFWNTISKKFSDYYHNNQLVMIDAIGSIAGAIIGSILFKEALPISSATTTQWMWVMIYAVIQTINVGLIVYGFKNIEAQIGSLILPIEIIFALTFSYLIFGEFPQTTAFIGGFIIIASATLANIKHRQD